MQIVSSPKPLPNNCLDCSAPVGKFAKRCRACAARESWKYRERKPRAVSKPREEFPNNCLDCNVPIRKTAKRCKPCATRESWKCPERRAKGSIRKTPKKRCVECSREVSFYAKRCRICVNGGKHAKDKHENVKNKREEWARMSRSARIDISDIVKVGDNDEYC